MKNRSPTATGKENEAHVWEVRRFIAKKWGIKGVVMNCQSGWNKSISGRSSSGTKVL